MSDAYCGIGRIPNGQRRGTPKECLDKNQVRYYGIKEIKPNEFKKSVSGRKIISIKSKLLSNLAILRTKRKRAMEKITREKDQAQKRKLQSDVQKYSDFIKEVEETYRDLSKAYP